MKLHPSKATGIFSIIRLFISTSRFIQSKTSKIDENTELGMPGYADEFDDADKESSKGSFEEKQAAFRDGKLKSIGITCVGAVISIPTDLIPISKSLNVDVATVKNVLARWRRGKGDTELNLDIRDQ